MRFDFWSITLIAFAAQCFLLVAMVAIKKTTNQQAKITLLALLLVIGAVLVSNAISATYIYRQYPQIAGFSRGMVLLIGPLLLFYTKALLFNSFVLDWRKFGHFIPYLLAVVIIRYQQIGVTDQQYIKAVDDLMNGTSRADYWSGFWFVSYFIHLFSYGLLIRSTVLEIHQNNKLYQVSIEQRIKWIKLIQTTLLALTTVFIGITLYISVTGFYTITGNFIYVLVLAFLVYAIAFKAVTQQEILSPHFELKYKTWQNNDQQSSAELIGQLMHLLEDQKLFLDPDLTAAGVAQKLSIHPNQLSHLINQHFNRNFNDLINQYRIEEFKRIALLEKYHHYSIIGLAYEVGYNSKSTFNTAFKKFTGKTPGQYLTEQKTL